VIARLLAALQRDADRALVGGLALVALGIVTTLRSLADAAGQWSDALPLGDRIVLGLYHARPVHALPFLVGAVLVVLALRLRRQAADTTAGVVAGVAWAYVALGVVSGVAALYTAVTGTFGEEAALVELTRRERSFGLAEQVVGSLAVALAALAAARALLGTPEPAPAASLEDDEEDDEEEVEAEAALDPAALAARYGRGNGWPAEAAPGTVPVAPGPTGAPGAEDIYGQPAPPTAAERNRQIYDQKLRFSPRAAEARALIARLRDDPDDDEAQRAFDRLARPSDAVD
jgi:hypothetical protein